MEGIETLVVFKRLGVGVALENKKLSCWDNLCDSFRGVLSKRKQRVWHTTESKMPSAFLLTY